MKALTEGNMGTSSLATIALLAVAGLLVAIFGFRVIRFAISFGSFAGGVAIGALLIGKNYLVEPLGGEIAALAVGGLIGIVIGLILRRLVNGLYNKLLFLLFTPLLIIATSLLGSFLVAFAIGGFLPIGNLIVTLVLGLVTIIMQSKAAIFSKKNRMLARFGGVLSKLGVNVGSVSDDFVGGFLKGYGRK